METLVESQLVYFYSYFFCREKIHVFSERRISLYGKKKRYIYDLRLRIYCYRFGASSLQDVVWKLLNQDVADAQCK